MKILNPISRKKVKLRGHRGKWNKVLEAIENLPKGKLLPVRLETPAEATRLQTAVSKYAMGNGRGGRRKRRKIFTHRVGKTLYIGED